MGEKDRENENAIRRTNGQFQKGHPALDGAGRRKGTGRNQRMLRAFKDCFNDDDVEQMATILKEKALDGDFRAIKLILEFLLPKSIVLQSAMMDNINDEMTEERHIGEDYRPYPLTTNEDWFQDENGGWHLREDFYQVPMP